MGTWTPHVVYSRFRIGDENLYEIAVSTWIGHEWITDVPYADLLFPPTAGVAANGASHLEVGFVNSEGRLKWCHFNLSTRKCDFDDRAQLFDVVRKGVSVAVADNGTTVFGYYQGPNGLRATRVAKVLPNGVQIEALEAPIPSCGGGSPSVEAFPDGRARITCLNTAKTQVTYAWEQPTGMYLPEQALPAVPGADVWAVPDLTIHNGYAHIIAHNVTQGEIWHAEQTAQGWVRTLVAAGGPGLGSLSVTVSPAGIVAVAVQFDQKIMYYERLVGQQAFGRATRIDGGAGDGFESCAPLKEPVHHAFVDEDTLHVAWNTLDLLVLPGQPENVRVARFTQWHRADQRVWSEANLHTHPLSAVALDSTGTPWTCFYDESANAPPEIDVFIKHGDDPAILLAQDVGLPSSYARGCDVAITANDKVGVAFSDSTAGRLRFYEGTAAGLFNAGPDIQCPALGDGPYAAEHVALAIRGEGLYTAAFARGVTKEVRYAELGLAWNCEAPDARDGMGYYLDLTHEAESDRPMISYYGFDAAQGFAAAWVASDEPGGWSVEQISAPGAGFDTSIDSRLVNDSPVTAVSYYDYTNGEAQVALLELGAWNAEVVDEQSAGEYSGVHIDAHGRPMLSHRGYDLVTQDSVLRLARWARFAGGRTIPNPPVPRFEVCSIEKSGRGTSLTADVFDNWRVAHKEYLGGFAHTLRFLTRP